MCIDRRNLGKSGVCGTGFPQFFFFFLLRRLERNETRNQRERATSMFAVDSMIVGVKGKTIESAC